MLLNFHSEIYSWVRGGLFVLFIYHILIFFQNKSNLYLFYSLYLLALTIYLSQSVIPSQYDWFNNYIHFFIQFLAYAAYIAFGRELLDTRSHLIKWDRYFSIAIKVLLIMAPMFVLIQFVLGFNFQIKAFTVLAPILTVFAFKSYHILITKINDSYSRYFVLGSLIYVVFANINFIQLVVGSEIFDKLNTQPIFFVYLGAILQCLIFAVIIGSIIKRIEQKSKNAEVRLANKLKEMEELKMVALQSQMNPHFLFNSLNSINNFVIKNDVEKASDYITKFSKLIRVILNSSSSPTSTLSEELKILELYVKMEQMRVTGGFDYIVDIDRSLKLEAVKVPTLFLQPFIENAIWHGIMKKEGAKRIQLTVKKEGDSIFCVVLDNGIGINKAKELKYMSQKRKFYGAEATENRIRILYKNKNVQIITRDISSKQVTGTEVSIQFPLE